MARLPLVALLCLLGAPSPALAVDVSLILSGSEYQGGPAFQLSIGEKVVGDGVVDPLPAAGQANVYSFEVPDSYFTDNAELRVRLTNDAFGGNGKDRNLYIFGASVDGHQVTTEQFSILLKGEPIVRKIKNNHIDIWSSQEVAVVSAPEGGWLTPVDVAVAAPVDAAPIADTPPKCDATASIVAIESLSKPLTAAQMARLDPILAQSKSGLCKIELTGYASQGGSDAANMKASEGRAKLVLAALEAKGARFAAVVVQGGGATTKFGGDDSSNRRVEVLLSQPLR